MELVIDTIVHMQEDQKRKAQMTKPWASGTSESRRPVTLRGESFFLCETPVKPYHHSVWKILI
jgi:hypothetical protein